jgi:peptide/nickel transport system substrate-binding protein
MKPFDDVRVRQAIAWAVPYKEIYKSVVYDICIPMSGGPAGAPKTAAWPQPFPYKREMEKAKAEGEPPRWRKGWSWGILRLRGRQNPFTDFWQIWAALR